MKSTLHIILLFFITTSAFSQTLPTVVKRIEGFRYPESVAFDGKYYYVSNLGNVLDPMAKDGDGFITKLNRYGDILEVNAFPQIKLNSPKGLTVVDEILYLTDVDSVMGIDIKTKKILWGTTIFGTKYLNDILLRDENTLYVTASDIGNIYEIDRLSDSIRILPMTVKINAPNGLSTDLISNYIYIASYGDDKDFGEIGRLNLRTMEYEKIMDEMGKFDGLFYANGRYYFSDWGRDGKGRMLVHDIRTGETKELKPDTGYFKGPADFYVEINSRRVWLPCMLENAVYILNSR